MELGDKQIYSFAFIGISAVVFMILERIYPYNPQKLLRGGFFDDFVWYNFVQSYALGLFISELISWMDMSSGISRLQLLSDWPVWAQLLLFLVTHDLYIYWMHRWQHHNKYLWRLHEAHHSVPDVDWLSGVRSHPLEIIINQTIEFAPIVLLGAAPEVAVYKGAISAVWGMFIHSNLNVRLGWLQYVFNGPEMHRWHHERDLRIYFANYSTKLAIWDWIFGTAFFPDPNKEKAKDYGLEPDPTFPLHNYFAQTVAAFRRFEKEVRTDKPDAISISKEACRKTKEDGIAHWNWLTKKSLKKESL